MFFFCLFVLSVLFQVRVNIKCNPPPWGHERDQHSSTPSSNSCRQDFTTI